MTLFPGHSWLQGVIRMQLLKGFLGDATYLGTRTNLVRIQSCAGLPKLSRKVHADRKFALQHNNSAVSLGLPNAILSLTAVSKFVATLTGRLWFHLQHTCAKDFSYSSARIDIANVQTQRMLICLHLLFPAVACYV